MVQKLIIFPTGNEVPIHHAGGDWYMKGLNEPGSMMSKRQHEPAYTRLTTGPLPGMQVVECWNVRDNALPTVPDTYRPSRT